MMSLSRGEDIFEDLQASRPRSRTLRCVLEAKDVPEDSISGSNLFDVFAFNKTEFLKRNSHLVYH